MNRGRPLPRQQSVFLSFCIQMTSSHHQEGSCTPRRVSCARGNALSAWCGFCRREGRSPPLPAGPQRSPSEGDPHLFKACFMEDSHYKRLESNLKLIVKHIYLHSHKFYKLRNWVRRLSLKLKVIAAWGCWQLGLCSGSVTARFVADPGSCLEQLCSISGVIVTWFGYTGCY